MILIFHTWFNHSLLKGHVGSQFGPGNESNTYFFTTLLSSIFLVGYAFGDKSKNSFYPSLPPNLFFFPLSFKFLYFALKSVMHVKLILYKVHDLRFLVLFWFIACVCMISPEPIVEKTFSSPNSFCSFVKC